MNIFATRNFRLFAVILFASGLSGTQMGGCVSDKLEEIAPGFDCNENCERGGGTPVAPPGGVPLGPLPSGNNGLIIQFNPGPDLQNNPGAFAAMKRAARAWEAIIADAVTISLDVDFTPLSEPNILAQARSFPLAVPYEDYRNALLRKAAADEAYVHLLPTAGALRTIGLPPGFGFNGNLVGVNKPLLRALGFDVPGLDGIIRINSNGNTTFDLDNRDGISGNQTDLETVLIHEIGHVLGFNSAVDFVDHRLAEGDPATIIPRVIDLFRFAPGAGRQFTTSPRIIGPGLGGSNVERQVFFDGNQDLELSTGGHFGDTNPASHWKDDGLTGTTLGVMDPTLGRGRKILVSNNDKRLLDVIGWDVR
jgi:hypothetical protein